MFRAAVAAQASAAQEADRRSASATAVSMQVGFFSIFMFLLFFYSIVTIFLLVWMIVVLSAHAEPA